MARAPTPVSRVVEVFAPGVDGACIRRVVGLRLGYDAVVIEQR
jgi:hypothetical protein